VDYDTLIAAASGKPRWHTWTRDEDIVVAGVYILSGTSNQPREVKERLAELIGCPVSSVAMRFGNVDACLGSGRLTSVAKQTREDAEELNALPRDEVNQRTKAAFARLEKRHGDASQP